MSKMTSAVYLYINIFLYIYIFSILYLYFFRYFIFLRQIIICASLENLSHKIINN